MRPTWARTAQGQRLLVDCSSPELVRLDQLCTELDLPAGKRLCRQGELGREAFLILAGHAWVDRDHVTVTVVGPGEVVGELSLLDRVPRSATVTALTPVHLLVFSVSEFHNALAGVPGFASAVHSAAAQHRRELARHRSGAPSVVPCLPGR